MGSSSPLEGLFETPFLNRERKKGNGERSEWMKCEFLSGVCDVGDEKAEGGNRWLGDTLCLGGSLCSFRSWSHSKWSIWEIRVLGQGGVSWMGGRFVVVPLTSFRCISNDVTLQMEARSLSLYISLMLTYCLHHCFPSKLCLIFFRNIGFLLKLIYQLI